MVISCSNLLGQGLAGKALLVENGIQAQLDNTPQCLKEDATVHLACAQHAVDEHNGYLLDNEAHTVGCKLHFNLERIALELDAVQVDGR